MKTADIESKVKETDALNPHVSKWTIFRRWLGIYTVDEREVLEYAKRTKTESILVLTGQKILTSRPDWMRYEDYKKLQGLQKQAERKRRRR